MAAQVRVKKVRTGPLRRRFSTMVRRSNNFKPVFRWAMRELANAHEQLFATEGAAAGGRWERLNEEYASWKLENYGANGILVADGSLRRSLTAINSGRGVVRDIGASKAQFGTSIPYADYHFTGTRKMPERKPIFVPRTFSDRTAFVVGRYIMDGQKGIDAAAAAAKVTI